MRRAGVAPRAAAAAFVVALAVVGLVAGVAGGCGGIGVLDRRCDAIAVPQPGELCAR